MVCPTEVRWSALYNVETFLVKEGKTFTDLIQQTLAAAPFGDAAGSFEVFNVAGNSDAQVLPMDIGSLIPLGIRIGRGTKDQMRVRVQDDLTGLEFFTVRILGFKHHAL